MPSRPRPEIAWYEELMIESMPNAPWSGATAITANELIDLQHSVTAPYRQGAAFVMNDSTVKAVRRLVDSNGVYVWAPGLVSAPDEILGNPVYADTNMSAMTSGLETVVYGNFTRG